MASVELEIVRSGSSEFVVQVLPDGSTAIFEVATKNVYSLNQSAAAAWEECASATTLSRLATAMSRRLNRTVTEDLAHEAVSELVAVGLVNVTPAERLGTSRRAMLKQVAGVALPVVLVLTGAEQRAHAQSNGSNPPLTTQPGTTSPGTTSPGTTAPPTTAPPTTAPPTTQAPRPPLTIAKAVAASFDATEGRVPLEGAEFDVLDGGDEPGGRPPDNGRAGSRNGKSERGSRLHTRRDICATRACRLPSLPAFPLRDEGRSEWVRLQQRAQTGLAKLVSCGSAPAEPCACIGACFPYLDATE